MLLERTTEVAALDAAIERARLGVGALVVIEGKAGLGKSRLVQEARDRALARGMRCLRGRGAELERELGFGVARQVLVPALIELRTGERERLLAGLAAGADQVLGAATSSPENGPDQAALVDAMYWLVYEVTRVGSSARPRPATLITVDDAQWADVSTLRLLIRLAADLDGLALVIVVGIRAGERADEAALMRLANHPAATVLRPAALSDDAVAALVRDGLGGDTAPELCRQCAIATGGNPFLVRELVATLQDRGIPDAETAADVAQMVPDSVLASVMLRLSRLASGAVALARAASVLGPDAPLRHGARLAGLSPSQLELATRALLAAGILAGADPLAFTHPLIAAAVQSDIPRLEQARAHGEAAELLGAENAPCELIAAHLCETTPAGDTRVVELLRRAAASALASGDAPRAVRLLERALAEPPPADERSPLVLELALAEAATGSPRALDRIADVDVPRQDARPYAQALQAMCRLLFARGEVRAAVEAAQRARAMLDPDDPLALRIFASQLAVMFFVPGGWTDTEELIGELEAAAAAGRLPDDPLLLSQLATRRAVWLGEGSDRLRPLAATLLASTSDPGDVWQGDAGMASALVFGGEFDLAGRVLERMDGHVRRSGSSIQAGMAAHWRSQLNFRQGWVADAAVGARRVLQIHDREWGFETTWCAALLAQARLELADLGGAQVAIEIGEAADAQQLPYGFLLHARAEVALAGGDAARAHRDFIAAGAHLNEFALDNPAVVPWRSGAAHALVSLGDSACAFELASTELDAARATGVAHAIGGSLRAVAAAAPEPQRTAHLCEAVELLAESGAQLEHVRALEDLGLALLAARDVSGARETLGRALDLARRLGTTAVATRAYRALRDVGARPSPRHRGTDAAALTPAERRVAELAAQDFSNAQIAKHLFVTPRTVEWHLTQSYRKLGIRSRAGLAQALGDRQPTASG